MLEYGQQYHLGPRTFFFMFIRYGWWMTILAASIAYLGWQFLYGSAGVWLAGFLERHPDLFLDTFIIILMTFLIALSVLFVALLRTYVLFKQYKFAVDKKAFKLRRGLFRIREIRVPYLQITTVRIEQPYHYRFLGLAQLDVVMNTDASAAKTIHNHKRKEDQLFLLPLIDKNLAHLLSNHLMRHSTGELDEEDDEYEYAYEDEIPEEELHLWETARER
ncbi:MAG: hypothetical protein RI911_716 [Candidatus Parcubacteria bacterium]|jgi:uncharacterized membrane protein YdbT with pleckstrin-like domain